MVCVCGSYKLYVRSSADSLIATFLRVINLYVRSSADSLIATFLRVINCTCDPLLTL